MKRQITQFDNDRSNATVATPTCSSCCCCCCCLTTAATSSVILARRINKEAKEKNVKDRLGLTTLAALYLPITGVAIWGIYTLINSSLGTCVTRQTGGEGYVIMSWETAYKVCSTPGDDLLLPIAVIMPILILTYLYARVKMQKPVLRAIVVALIVAIAGFVEGAVGAALILTGVGAVFYLCVIPILFAVVQAFYGRHVLHKDVTRKNASDAWRT